MRPAAWWAYDNPSGEQTSTDSSFVSFENFYVKIVAALKYRHKSTHKVFQNQERKEQNSERLSKFFSEKSERNIIEKKRNEINEVEKLLEDIKYFQIRRIFFLVLLNRASASYAKKAKLKPFF